MATSWKLAVSVQHGRLASSKCWICLTVQCWSMVRLAGAADLNILQWPDFKTVGTLCRLV